MPVDITENDIISRCIIFARFFDREAHSDELLWKFESSDGDGRYLESGVLRRLAPADSDVHRIGCHIAAQQNERLKQPPPGLKRRYYCGFRSARYSDLPTKGNGYSLEIVNCPEHGEESHVNVILSIEALTKSARAVRRTDAGLAMAECFGEPVAHVCHCDVEDAEHPLNRLGSQCLTSRLRDRWPDLVLKETNLYLENIGARAEGDPI